jgi:tetratricopeptide (TPR) repeat protein
MLAASPVRAEKVNPVEKLAADAASAYRAGEFSRAAQLLERAYRIQPVAALLYNLAKAYEKLGDDDKAADLYARYASADDADPKLRTKAEARVAALHPPPRPDPKRTTVAMVAPAPPAVEKKPPPEPTHAEPSPPSPPVVAAPPPPDAGAERRKEAERIRTRDRNIAIGVGAVGVAALVSAVALSGNVLALQSQFDASTDETQKRNLRADATTRAGAADGLYVGGAACVGVAAYFLWRGLRPLPSNVAVAPVLTPSGGGIVAQGRF